MASWWFLPPGTWELILQYLYLIAGTLKEKQYLSYVEDTEREYFASIDWVTFRHDASSKNSK